MIDLLRFRSERFVFERDDSELEVNENGNREHLSRKHENENWFDRKEDSQERNESRLEKTERWEHMNNSDSDEAREKKEEKEKRDNADNEF